MNRAGDHPHFLHNNLFFHSLRPILPFSVKNSGGQVFFILISTTIFAGLYVEKNGQNGVG